MGSGADSPCQGEMSRSDRGGRVAVLWARSARRPRPPAILWFLSHRWERNSPRRANPPAYNNPNPKPAPSSVTASPCHLPPKGKAFWRSTLIRPFGPPFCPFGTFPPDRGDRPSPSKGEGLRAADSRPYRRRGAYGGRVRTPALTQIQGRSQTGPRAATWGRPCGGNRPPGEE